MSESTLVMVRSDSTDERFRRLVVELDRDLAIRDGDEHSFYAQYNKIDMIRHVIVALDGETAVGCGAIKSFGEPETVEVKRMYVPPEFRGRRIATHVLAALEEWAIELGFARAVLETGLKQPEAIAVYTRSGYRRIPNYGQYIGMENSVCFEKQLAPMTV